MPIGTVEVQINTYQLSIGTSQVSIRIVEVLIGTLNSFVQNLFSYTFWTLFGIFLSWELYLDVSWTCILDKIHLKLIIKTLK